MTPSIMQSCFQRHYGSIVGLLLIGSTYGLSCCRGDSPTPPSSTPAPAMLNSEIVPVPLSATEADRFFAVTATTGNQYYAAGFTTVNEDSQMAVAHFGTTGALDTSFGTNGFATTNIALDTGKKAELARAVVVQSNSTIVIAGPIEHDTAATGDTARDTDIVIVRFDTTGQVDHTFGTNAITTVLFRLLPDGQLDSTFGQNGIVHLALLGFIAEAYDVELQGQNLIIAGYGRDTSTGTVDILSARFLANGTWDKTYRDRGVAIIDVASQDDRSRTLKVLPDQRVLIVGQGKQTATTQEGAVVLLAPNGQRETRLNGNGVALIDFSGPTDALFGLSLSPDLTKAVAVGWKGVNTSESSPTNNDDARIVRFPLPSGL